MPLIWLVPSFVVLTLIVLGPLTANLGWLDPGAGFGLFLMGLGVAFVSAIGLAGLGALGSAMGRPWRRAAIRGAILPFLVVVPAVIAMQGNDAPVINDVSTDLEERPVISPDVAAPPPGPEAAAQLDFLLQAQREYYPDVKPLLVGESPREAFAHALRVAQQMPDWTISGSEPGGGRIRAVATSTVFRFQDDVVIRVRPDARGARIDLRSRSRSGRSDLGANATRIREFIAAYGSREASSR